MDLVIDHKDHIEEEKFLREEEEILKREIVEHCFLESERELVSENYQGAIDKANKCLREEFISDTSEENIRDLKIKLEDIILKSKNGLLVEEYLYDSIQELKAENYQGAIDKATRGLELNKSNVLSNVLEKALNEILQEARDHLDIRINYINKLGEYTLLGKYTRTTPIKDIYSDFLSLIEGNSLKYTIGGQEGFVSSPHSTIGELIDSIDPENDRILFTGIKKGGGKIYKKKKSKHKHKKESKRRKYKRRTKKSKTKRR
jgi:hypothetical protein